MGGPSKAKRPKRRWIGMRLSIEINRDGLNSILNQMSSSSSAKLYDFKSLSGENIAIVRVNLSEVTNFMSNCQADNRIETITTSGKIRLVRDRLGIPKPKVRR